eukprot:TRINITY_DN7075_c0_g1_i1.p1 TRINITY_DN7075_c0_g1~~TRINITY_DN7075_c0_g1_i1.p1  ORF type:complete len:166 (+),score=20.66 TRINITY_DN7075_c0_g1_i1:55-552(+)
MQRCPVWLYLLGQTVDFINLGVLGLVLASVLHFVFSWPKLADTVEIFFGTHGVPTFIAPHYCFVVYPIMNIFVVGLSTFFQSSSDTSSIKEEAEKEVKNIFLALSSILALTFLVYAQHCALLLSLSGKCPQRDLSFIFLGCFFFLIIGRQVGLKLLHASYAHKHD